MFGSFSIHLLEEGAEALFSLGLLFQNLVSLLTRDAINLLKDDVTPLGPQCDEIRVTRCFFNPQHIVFEFFECPITSNMEATFFYCFREDEI